MPKGRWASEHRQTDNSMAKVVSTMLESVWVDEATILYWKALFDNPILMKTPSIFAYNSVLFSKLIQLWVVIASR